MDPFTKKPVYIAKALSDRKLQRALMQFFKPENYFEVLDALRQAKRMDLVGDGCDSLIPARPPKEALEARRRDANDRFRGEFVHTIPNKQDGQGESQRYSKPNGAKGKKPGKSSAAKRPKKSVIPHQAGFVTEDPALKQTKSNETNPANGVLKKQSKKEQRAGAHTGYRPRRRLNGE